MTHNPVEISSTKPSAHTFPWLVADIGGSNARFGLILQAGGVAQHVQTVPVRAHSGPAQAARTYLDGLAAAGTVLPRPPCKAAFAVATAVAGDRIEFTNSHWGFSRAAVQAELGLDTFMVLNDFEALALSLPGLGPHQVRAHGAMPQPNGLLAVVGPGTGLGVGAVLPTAAGWIALPGEGGHATLAPVDDFESDLLAHVRKSYPHVSGERLLSGIGMPTLHGAVAALRGGGSAGGPALPTEQIVARGLDGSDAICSETLDVFCALLGGFAGSVALTLGARGGVYIGGGIVPRLGERFFQSQFRTRFESKGRFDSYLKCIPTALITDTLVALAGSAMALEQGELGCPART